MTQKERRELKRRARLCGLRLVREATYPQENDRPQIRSPRDVAALMGPIAEREPTEVFWLLALDSQHRLLAGGPIAITRGILNSSLIHPREAFRAAIVAGAAAIVCAHNHPSGDPTPSADDRAVTSQLVAAGRLLDIPVHDHVVIGAGGKFTSLAEAGLI
jgi:DNA repair protein RadC